MAMIIGIFNGTDIELATNALHAAGFTDDKIQIMNDAPDGNANDAPTPLMSGDDTVIPLVPLNLGGSSGASVGMSPLAGGLSALPASGNRNVSLSGLHLPPQATSFYQESLKNGATIIAVTANTNEIPRIHAIFEQAHAANIAEPDAS